MANSEPSAKIAKFIGLNNRAEPRTLGPGELVQGDNIEIDDRFRIRRRRGVSRISPGSITAMWATPDERRLFLIVDGVLVEAMGDPPAYRVLSSPFDASEAYWDWDGERVFLSHPSADVVIDGDAAYALEVPTPFPPDVTIVSGSLPTGRYLVGAVITDAQGRQGGMSYLDTLDIAAASGLQLTLPRVPSGCTARFYASRTNDSVLRSLPGAMFEHLEQLGAAVEAAQFGGYAPAAGGPIAYHAGRLVKLSAVNGTCLVSFSHPYWPHLFHYADPDFQVPGNPVAVADVGHAALLVATDRGIWRFHLDEGLALVADYGAVPGQNRVMDAAGRVYLWTQRGLCRAFPFENLTEQAISVPPGARCALGMIEYAGFARVAVLSQLDGGDGDTADNPR